MLDHRNTKYWIIKIKYLPSAISATLYSDRLYIDWLKDIKHQISNSHLNPLQYTETPIANTKYWVINNKYKISNTSPALSSMLDQESVHWQIFLLFSNFSFAFVMEQTFAFVMEQILLSSKLDQDSPSLFFPFLS